MAFQWFRFWNRLHGGVRIGRMIIWTGWRGGKWFTFENTGMSRILFLGIPNRHHSITISWR